MISSVTFPNVAFRRPPTVKKFLHHVKKKNHERKKKEVPVSEEPSHTSGTRVKSQLPVSKTHISLTSATSDGRVSLCYKRLLCGISETFSQWCNAYQAQQEHPPLRQEIQHLETRNRNH